MSVKIKYTKTKVIKEDEYSYSITCSALGVYSICKNLQDTKKLSKCTWASFICIKRKDNRSHCNLKKLSPIHVWRISQYSF